MRSASPAFLKFGTSRWFFGAAVLWALFVFFFFFSQFPTDWKSFSVLLDIGRFPPVSFSQSWQVWNKLAGALAVCLLTTGILWACGRRLRRWLGLSAGSAETSWALELGLGFFFLSTLWLGLGLARLWTQALWLPGFLVLAVLFVKDLSAVRKKPLSWDIPRVWKFWAALIGTPYLFLLVFHSLLPETFYDSLNYFLGLPSFWLFQHGITDNPVHLKSGYLYGGSLFYLNGLVLAGTEGAKALNLTVMAGILLASYGWIKEMAGSLAATICAAALLTFPLLFLNLWAVRVDALTVFALLLFFYCLDHSLRASKNPGGWVVAAGIFAGLAVSVKPVATAMVAAGLLACLWQNGRPFLKKTNWVLLGALLVFEVGPWLLKNACFTGNAFFPYASSWMGGRFIPAENVARLLHENRQFLPMDQGLWSIVTLPWRLSMPGAGDGQFIGPMVLAFAPVLFFVRTRNASFGFILKTLILGFTITLCFSHMLRFSLCNFLLVLMACSVLFASEATRPWRRLWATAVMFCGLMCFGNYLGLSVRYYDGTGIWSGREKQEAYLDRKLANSYEPLAEWTNRELPENARLLIVGDARGVYYRRDFLAQSQFDDSFFAEAVRSSRDAEGILQRLRESGITHVVVNIPEGLRNSREYHQYRLTSTEWKRLNDFARSGLRPVYWKSFQAVYEVKAKLGAEEGRAVVNPFSFFADPIPDYLRFSEAGDEESADRELDKIISLFPEESYWWEKKAGVNQTLGNTVEALEAYRTADSFKGLSAGGYRRWMGLAEKNGQMREISRARVRAHRAYPELFQD